MATPEISVPQHVLSCPVLSPSYQVDCDVEKRLEATK